jgi:hypothetical protein
MDYFSQCPIAVLTLVNAESVSLFSAVGLDNSCKEFSRCDAFDSLTILPESAPVIQIYDASKDFRFSSSILVNGPLALRFYAGVSIVLEDVKIGTLAIMDSVTHPDFEEEHKQQLKVFGNIFNAIVMNRFENDCQLTIDDSLTKTILLNNLKEIKFNLNTLLKNQEEFSSLMKLLSGKNSSSGKTNLSRSNKSSASRSNLNKDSAEISQQEMLMSIDSLQTLLQEQTKGLQSQLQHSFVLINSLKNLSSSSPVNNNNNNSSPDNYQTVNDYLRKLKKHLITSRQQEHIIKFEFDDSETWKVYDSHQEPLAAIMSLYVQLSLMKWKNVTVSLGFVDETGRIRRNSVEATSSHSQTKTGGENSQTSGLPTKPGKICLEMACFHRSSNSFKDEVTLSLLDQLVMNMMELLQGSFEKTISNSSDTFKFIVNTTLQSKPKVVRRSVFLRNSIVAFLDDGTNLLERALAGVGVTGGAGANGQQTNGQVKKADHPPELTASTSNGSQSSLQINPDTPIDAQKRKKEVSFARGTTRRNSLINTPKNKIKGNIITSLFETLTGSGALKKSMVIPVDN